MVQKNERDCQLGLLLDRVKVRRAMIIYSDLMHRGRVTRRDRSASCRGFRPSSSYERRCTDHWQLKAKLSGCKVCTASCCRVTECETLATPIRGSDVVDSGDFRSSPGAKRLHRPTSAVTEVSKALSHRHLAYPFCSCGHRNLPNLGSEARIGRQEFHR